MNGLLKLGAFIGLCREAPAVDVPRFGCGQLIPGELRGRLGWGRGAIDFGLEDSPCEYWLYDSGTLIDEYVDFVDTATGEYRIILITTSDLQREMRRGKELRVLPYRVISPF